MPWSLHRSVVIWFTGPWQYSCLSKLLETLHTPCHCFVSLHKTMATNDVLQHSLGCASPLLPEEHKLWLDRIACLANPVQQW